VIGEKIYLCLRGLHLHENIQHAVSSAVESMNNSPRQSAESGVAMGAAASSRASQLSPNEIKILKGKRALEILCREFLSNEESSQKFLSYFSEHSLRRYVPDWVISPAVAATSLPPSVAFSSSTGNPLLQEHATVVRSLFPPGNFQAISVILIPFPRHDNATGGIFFRIFKKLEKENLQIKSVTSLLFTLGMARYCAQEIYEDEYSYDLLHPSSSPSFPSSSLHTPEEEEKEILRNFLGLVDQPVLAVIVSGNSALLRLRSIIGPVDPTRALEHYPSSVIGNLASFSTLSAADSSPTRQTQSSSSSLSSSPPQPPYAFFSRTCQSTAFYLTNFLHLKYSLQELSLFPSLTTGDFISAEDEVDDSFVQASMNPMGSMREEKERRETMVRELKDSSYKAQQQRDQSSRQLVFGTPSPTSGSVSISTMTSHDATCIVLTSALMIQHGISPIFAAIHKEGIKVNQSFRRMLSHSFASPPPPLFR
jgi:nucleoside diphosphate kinase